MHYMWSSHFESHIENWCGKKRINKTGRCNKPQYDKHVKKCPLQVSREVEQPCRLRSFWYIILISYLWFKTLVIIQQGPIQNIRKCKGNFGMNKTYSQIILKNQWHISTRTCLLIRMGRTCSPKLILYIYLLAIWNKNFSNSENPNSALPQILKGMSNLSI